MYSLFETKYDHPDPISGSLIPRLFSLRRKFASTARKYEYSHLRNALVIVCETRRGKCTFCPHRLYPTLWEGSDRDGDMPGTPAQMYRLQPDHPQQMSGLSWCGSHHPV